MNFLENILDIYQSSDQ